MQATFGTPTDAMVAALRERPWFDAALAVAERIRIEAEALAIPHAASPVAGHITVSIGVATVTPDSDGAPVRLVDSADRALYRAKEKGRNRLSR